VRPPWDFRHLGECSSHTLFRRRRATRRYFAACNDWLARTFACAQVAEPRRKALGLTALLQGAMLQTIALGDVAAFDDAVGEPPDAFG
jgi:hypothetical protein